MSQDREAGEGGSQTGSIRHGERSRQENFSRDWEVGNHPVRNLVIQITGSKSLT